MKRDILRHDVVLAFDAPDVTLEAAGGKGCSLTALVRADQKGQDSISDGKFSA